MSDTHFETSHQGFEADPPPKPRHTFTGKLGLLIALTCMLIGIAWPMLHKDTPAPTSGALTTTLTDHPGAIDSAVDGAKKMWSSGLFRLGFSFAAAYAVAYALRGFFNFTLASLGFFIAALIGLQYAGVMKVTWIAGNEQFESFLGWLGHQFSSVKQIVTGALPSGFASALGIWSGWRR